MTVRREEGIQEVGRGRGRRRGRGARGRTIKPDFICLNETWANADITGAYLKVPGFSIICRKDSVDTNRGVCGGLFVCLFERRHVPLTRGRYMLRRVFVQLS